MKYSKTSKQKSKYPIGKETHLDEFTEEEES